MALCVGFGAPQADVYAASPRTTQVKVTLFGQPCTLQGPLDERTLKLVHSLSPEQLYPDRDATLTAAPTRKALDLLHSVSGVPAGLDRYRERLGRRLDAQLALLEAFDSYRKSHKSQPILATAKDRLNAPKYKEFETTLKKAETAKTLGKNDVFDSLFDYFSDGIEADPEEEFHRAIQRMNVVYTCSFEENGNSAGEDGGD